MRAAMVALVLVSVLATACTRTDNAAPASATVATSTTTVITTTTDAAAAIEAVLAENEVTLVALEQANDEALRAELARIETAAEREAADATNRLLGFRRQVVAFWADFWVDPPVERDSLEGFLMGGWPETAMLQEIDFALSQVESNADTARRNAEFAAERAASDRLYKEVILPYAACLDTAVEVGASVERFVAVCSPLLEFDGPPEWPSHDWSCVRSNVEAVLSMRPDDDYTPGARTEAVLERLFDCQGLQPPDWEAPP